MNKAVIICRVLLGVMFAVFGLNGFLHFIPQPPPPPGLAGGLLSRDDRVTLSGAGFRGSTHCGYFVSGESLCDPGVADHRTCDCQHIDLSHYVVAVGHRTWGSGNHPLADCRVPLSRVFCVYFSALNSVVISFALYSFECEFNFLSYPQFLLPCYRRKFNHQTSRSVPIPP